jgi:hypothetical protein
MPLRPPDYLGESLPAYPVGRAEPLPMAVKHAVWKNSAHNKKIAPVSFAFPVLILRYWRKIILAR